MLLKFWQYIKGSVYISVRGFSRERFLNLIAANDIFAWNIKNYGKEIRLCLTVAGLKKIKPLLKKTNCRFKILSRSGLPFLLHRYRHRKIFACGCAAFFVIIFLMSQFIWLIEIKGNTVISDTEILTFCEKRGVYTGINKHKIDIPSLKEDLLSAYPQISWLSITQNGTRLLIDMAENVKNTEILDYSEPCDIISIRDCIITEITVQNGTPKVRAGDTVKQGDLLVSAAFDTLDENGQLAALPPVHSAGTVRGKWQQSFTVDVPYEHSVKTYTNRQVTLYSLKIFNKVFNTDFLNLKAKFKNFDVLKRSGQIGFSPDFPLPFVLNKTVYCEYTKSNERYSPEQAEKQAEVLINKKILNTVSAEGEVLERKTEVIHGTDSLTVKVSLLVEDNIGKESAFTQGGITGNGTNQAADR